MLPNKSLIAVADEYDMTCKFDIKLDLREME